MFLVIERPKKRKKQQKNNNTSLKNIQVFFEINKFLKESARRKNGVNARVLNNNKKKKIRSIVENIRFRFFPEIKENRRTTNTNTQEECTRRKLHAT